MVLQPKQYEGLLKSVLNDSWSRLDFVGDMVSLRIVNAKKLDSNTRVYFSARREQVVTGVRYSPIGSPFKLWPGDGYRIQTQIEVIEPIPEHVHALVVPHPDVATGGMNIIAGPIVPGFTGVVEFTVFMLSPMELHDMCAVGYLMFFGSETVEGAELSTIGFDVVPAFDTESETDIDADDDEPETDIEDGSDTEAEEYPTLPGRQSGTFTEPKPKPKPKTAAKKPTTTKAKAVATKPKGATNAKKKKT